MQTTELSELDHHVFAYYLTHAAQTLQIDGRFYPYGELVMSIRGKIQLNTSKFGKPVSSRADTVARYFVSQLIDYGALSDVPQKIGNNMHQFQPKMYRQFLIESDTGNEIVSRAKAQGEDFWSNAFASLVTEQVK